MRTRRQRTAPQWLAARCRDLLDGTAVPLKRYLGELEEQWLKLAGDEANAEREEACGRLVTRLLDTLHVRYGAWQAEPGRDRLPQIWLGADGTIALVRSQALHGDWEVETPAGRETWTVLPCHGRFLEIWTRLEDGQKLTSARAMFGQALREVRGAFVFVALATLATSVFAFGTSLYSMQVYDRVVPVKGFSTLLVLTIGVLIASVLEFALKVAKTHILEPAIEHVDGRLSKQIYERLLHVRLDCFPATVGTLASQVKSYETVRSFYFAAIALGIELPFALCFLVLIALLAGPILAAIALGFFVVALVLGLALRRRILLHTQSSVASANQKWGLLVQTVEGIETIKASGAQWQHQNRWNRLAQEALDDDLKIRRLSEVSGYLTAMMNQLSYVALIAAGAWYAISDGTITSGTLVACSILSGRVLAPVAMIPGLVSQWAYARVSLGHLDALLALRADNDAVERPLAPERFEGRFSLDRVAFAYAGQANPIRIERLEIAPGERVGVIGSIGSGKSTLLKILCGLYPAQSGRVLLDGLDVNHVSRQHLAEQCGYLPQDPRLFSGTLRDNLVHGLVGRDQEEIVEAARATGLLAHIAADPRGFDLPISEGGAGLSRGQRQLVAITRLVLQRPSIWLLDEPTSGMDEQTEVQAIRAIAATIGANDTLVVVTHRPRLTELVARLVVLGGKGLVLDGPKAQVLARMAAQVGPRPGGQPVSPPAGQPAPSAPVISLQRKQ